MSAAVSSRSAGGWIERSACRPRFEVKGRFRPYLEAIPTWVITGLAFHALNGANRALHIGIAGSTRSRNVSGRAATPLPRRYS